MSNLLAMLGSSGNALDVYQQALNVVQNNVNNAATPGYARQSLNLAAQPLDVAAGLAGGVAAAGLDNSRDQYVEEQVQRQTQALGQFTAQAQATGTLQSLFDASGNSGVPAALSTLYQSFSAWSVTPSDPTARQNVIDSAATLASDVQSLSQSLSQNSQQLDSGIASTTAQINSIAAQIQAYNVQRLTESTPDPGVDAQLHSALDSLSQLTNFSTVTQNDGTVTVLLGGGSPLVVGQQQYALSTSSSQTGAQILDSQGNDITSQITSGQLGGMLDVRNRVLSSMTGTLNQFATTLADTVNQTLESGTVSSDPGAAAGAPLFTYDNSTPGAAAATLAVNPAMTAAQLAPVDASGNSNGNANQLAALANTPLTQLGGVSLTQYFGQLASSIGNENQTATNNQQSQQQVVAQATTLLNQVSGVSLDEEAVNVLQFQRSYQAAAQVLTILNTLADSVLNLIPPL
ncbi:putative Flagellar hook-associated protein FlgK [Candidatus Sulfopaludibacter sp. SbA3]|nr:putative Flagellar hook-associated protein FlgK [Candidatus Sulfopaludibacter sp. SbA3]